MSVVGGERAAAETVRRRRSASGPGELELLPTRELVARIARKTAELARKEVELAKAEIRADVKTELRVVSGLGFAGLCLLLTLQLLLVALVLGVEDAGLLAGWQAALLVAAAVLLVGTVAGLLSWRHRVRAPLAATLRSARESVRWVKEQVQ